MTIRFACPNCRVTGSADASAVGKSARCKYCGFRFTIPAPGAVESDVYNLEEPAEQPAGSDIGVMDPDPFSAFAPVPGDEPATAAPLRPKKSATRSSTRKSSKRASRSAWPARLAWIAVVLAIIIAATAQFAPNGLLIAACAVIIIGCIMILVGFAVGAYGAFSEEFVYGFFYLVLPLYTAYYIVTRWYDLWVWFLCMTLGVGLILLGIEMARWGGVVV
jgi:hypothetical protein